MHVIEREKKSNLHRCSLLVEICIVSPVTRCSTAVAIRDTTYTNKVKKLIGVTDGLEETSNGKGQSRMTAGTKHSHVFALEDHINITLSKAGE
jgi:hypothetical protein